jgi:hypothetical protein
VRKLFDREPRAMAEIVTRTGVNEFNDVLVRRRVVAARQSF